MATRKDTSLRKKSTPGARPDVSEKIRRAVIDEAIQCLYTIRNLCHNCHSEPVALDAIERLAVVAGTLLDSLPESSCALGDFFDWADCSLARNARELGRLEVRHG